MISDGVVTVMVSDMDRAVEFYVDKLGLKLEYRLDNHWAQVRTESGFQIGLHPASPIGNPAGTRGSILIGLAASEPMEGVIERLWERGVTFDSGIKEEVSVRLEFFGNQEGNELYLCEYLSES